MPKAYANPGPALYPGRAEGRLAWVSSAFVALRTRWTRPPGRRLASAPALALAAALATVVPVTACTSSPAGTGKSATASAQRTAAPAITSAQARQVWDHYVAVSGAETVKAGDPALPLSVETGVQRAIDSASLRAFKSFVAPVFRTPTFFLPEQSGYPRFFVADVTRQLTSDPPPSAAARSSYDGAATYPLGPDLLLFEQASEGEPWLLASVSSLAVGEKLPKLATDRAGYVPAVRLSDTALLAQPDDVGPLQAAVVDDGPASAAAGAIAAGQLTTGLYRGALGHANGMKAPPGDRYQWELQGASYPEFALRTADGGALVFYAMTLNTTVAVPDVIDKGNPIHSGPPIQVPADLRMLLPPGRPAPLVQLQSQQVLSFTAIDPAPGKSKIQVIAMGGGLASAAAS
jgi:hypothetical protein